MKSKLVNGLICCISATFCDLMMIILDGIQMGRTPEDFWNRIEIGAPDDCWPMIRPDKYGGYAEYGYNGKTYKAHRLAYELHHGIILEKAFPTTKDSILVCHRCDRMWCCNPAHLFLGTPLDNRRDCSAKGRARKRRWLEVPD